MTCTRVKIGGNTGDPESVLDLKDKTYKDSSGHLSKKWKSFAAHSSTTVSPMKISGHHRLERRFRES
jgi:hypothetical protein